MEREPQSWLDEVPWNEHDLVAVVTQDHASGRVLTVAWMNRAALEETVRRGEAVYWSRSRKKLWRKGEESGHAQKLREVRLDCDADAILLKVDQVGGSCIVAPSGEIVAACTTKGDEIAFARCDLDLCNSYKRTIFNFDVHRQPHAYKMIVERKGQHVMADGTPVPSNK